MGRTFAQSAAAQDAHWIAIVTIEGSGVYGNTLYRYCSEVPTYAAGNSAYRDWLIDFPSISPEQVDVLGGLPSNGELSVSILDYGDALTSEWRTEADPRTYLAQSVDGSNTTLYVESTTGITAGSSVVYLGNEACDVSAVDAMAGTLTVTRARLGTDAFQHEEGTPIYLHFPYHRARRMRLYIVNRDAASAAQETEVGAYRIDYAAMTEDLNGWVLRGRSQLTWLSRLVARGDARTLDVSPVVAGTGQTDVRVLTLSPRLTRDIALGSAVWPGGRLVARVIDTGELLTVDAGTTWRIVDRGLHNTQVEPLPDPCSLRVVYSGDAALSSSWFGWSASSSAARADFVRSSNWIDIILNLIVSSADEADGLELNNRNSTYGAWDCLPVGIGIGTPHAEVDWAAAVAVRARTPDYVFPDFVIGEESEPFADVVTRHFLKPIGAYLSTVSGKARIVLPRFGVSGASAVEIGSAELLARPVGRARYENEMGAEQDLTGSPTQVVYVLSNGQRIETNNKILVQSAHYAHETKAIEIEAPSARSLGNDNRGHFLAERAVQRILRARRPAWLLTPSVSYEQYERAVGDALSVTHSDLPDLANGRRGWTGVYAEISQVTPKLDAERGYWHAWQAISYGPNVRVGRIAPAARIASATVSGGAATCTVTANRYAQSDASGDLPTTDAAGFAAGDYVELFSRAGVNLAPGSTAKINSIVGNAIELDGDFGGTITAGAGNAGQILRYATSADAIEQQLDSFVFWADLPSRTIGATARAPWHYGEP